MESTDGDKVWGEEWIAARTFASLGKLTSCSRIAILGPFFAEEPPWFYLLSLFLFLIITEILKSAK